MKVNNNITKTLFNLLHGLSTGNTVTLNDPSLHGVPVPYIIYRGALYVIEGNGIDPSLYPTVYLKDYAFELMRWIAERPENKQLEMLLELACFITTNDIVKTPHEQNGVVGHFIYTGGGHGPAYNEMIMKQLPSLTVKPDDIGFKNSFKWWLKESIKQRETSSKSVEKLGDKVDADQLATQIKLFGPVDANGLELFHLDNLADNFNIDRTCEESCFALAASVALFETLPDHVTTLQDIHASIKFFKSLFNCYMTMDKELYESRSGLCNAKASYNDIEDMLDQGMKDFINGNLENFITVFARYKESRKAYYDSLKA